MDWFYSCLFLPEQSTTVSYFNPSKLSKSVLLEPSNSKNRSTINDKSTHPGKVIQLLPNKDAVVSSEDRSPSVKEEDGITFYPQGEFIPVDSKWQKDKCKMLKLTFIIGIVSEDQSTEKKLDIRRLAPSKEKRISPDGNCLFSSLSYVITGTDCFHKEIRENLLENMKGQYKDICTNYCCSHYELLPEYRCHSVDDYITKSKMHLLGSWGTDMEIFLAVQILTTDIFVYRDSLQCWNKFSGYGFNNKKDVHRLTSKRIYLRLHHDHFQPVLKVDKVENCRIFEDLQCL